MDDIRDQMDIANEISDAISRPVGMGEELDEDELLNELEELEQEELDAKMLDTPAPAVVTPDVPVHKPCKLSREKERWDIMITDHVLFSFSQGICIRG